MFGHWFIICTALASLSLNIGIISSSNFYKYGISQFWQLTFIITVIIFLLAIGLTKFLIKTGHLKLEQLTDDGAPKK